MSTQTDPIKLLGEEFAALRAQNLQLSEDLERVRAQFAYEDRGWTLLNGQVQEDTGISLDTLKTVSQQLREEVAGSPLPKQANAVRYSYTFSQPFLIPGLDATIEAPTRGRPTAIEAGLKNLRSFYQSATAQRYVFGKAAQELISTACSTDSCYIILGDDKTKVVHPIPLHEIVGVYVDPDFPDEIWAYQREWNRPNSRGENEVQKRWYYTDTYEGTRQSSLPDSSGSQGTVEVDRGKTVIAFSTNNQVGWVWGLPDLMAGQVWNKKYIDLIYDGEKMSRALALLAGQVKAKSSSGADRMGVKFSNGEAGSMAATGEGNDISMFSSAGKAYQFRDLQPVAELYAASVGIAATDLLASPAASGSSYGAAQALGPGVRRAIEARRLQIAAWMERIIKWATGTDIQVTPANIQDIEPYRQAEILDRGWHTGLFHADEVRGEFAYLAGITMKHPKAPEGVLLPNNEESLPRKDIDTDGLPGKTNPDPVTDAGRSKSDSDKSTDSNDRRTDTLT